MYTLNDTPKDAALQLKDLTVRYESEKTVIKDLNLVLEPKTIYTLIGPSGCGKTTLLNVLAGIVPYTDGEILWNGRQYRPKEHIIGLVPQDYGLLPWQTGRETLEINMKIRKKTRKLSAEDHQKLDRILSLLKIDTIQQRYPISMSGGQKQRFSLARAFSIAPDMLLMDEPFSALDAMTREQTQRLFLSIWNKDPNLTLFITHDIEEAVLIGHEILIFSPNGTLAGKLKNPLGNLAYDAKREKSAFLELTQKLRKEIQQNETTL